MRHVILDLNALIYLQTPDQNPFRQIIEDPQTAIYVLDGVLVESVRWASGNGDRVLASLAPFVNRVFAGPAHFEVLQYERKKLRPMSANRMRRNERTESLRELVRKAAAGQSPLQNKLVDDSIRLELERSYVTSGRLMVHMYNSAHNAWVETDKLFGITGRPHSFLTALRNDHASADFVLHQCIKHALGGLYVEMRKGFGDVRLYSELLGQITFTFVHSLARWIRVYQQAYSNKMVNWQTSKSPEIVNEFFDVLSVSFFPYFDQYLSTDEANNITLVLLQLALQKFTENRQQYVERVKNLDTAWSPYPTKHYVRAARKRGRPLLAVTGDLIK